MLDDSFGLKKLLSHLKTKPTRNDFFMLRRKVHDDWITAQFNVRYVEGKETIVEYSTVRNFTAEKAKVNLTVEGARKIYKDYLEAGYKPWVKPMDNSPRCPENRDREDGGWSTK